MSQFLRNLPALSPEQQQLLEKSHVLVVGCGGLGGYVLELLARLGVGELTAADGDCFELSNLNRQLLSTHETLGQNKAAVAKTRVETICPDIRFHACTDFFSSENTQELLAGKDLVIDALDSIPDRLALERACAQAGLTILHGAVQGWMAQIAVVPPGSGMLARLYEGHPAAEDKSCLAFTPALCASLQCAEAVKVLCKEPSALSGRLLMADLRSMDFETIPL